MGKDADPRARHVIKEKIKFLRATALRASANMFALSVFDYALWACLVLGLLCLVGLALYCLIKLVDIVHSQQTPVELTSYVSSVIPQCSTTTFTNHTLPDGSYIRLSIVQHPDSSKPAITCDLCSKLIEMTASGGLAYFTQHRGSKSCKKKE